MPEPHQHHYTAHLNWTGETRDYRSYSREHEVTVPGKPPLRASADPAFLGDPSCHNPEDLVVVALSSCHMLWYLHLCAVKGVVVTAYEDSAQGTMVEAPRNGRFIEVVLRPLVTITEDSDAAKAEALHERAHAECYVANSVTFPVRCEPTIRKAGPIAA